MTETALSSGFLAGASACETVTTGAHAQDHDSEGGGDQQNVGSPAADRERARSKAC